VNGSELIARPSRKQKKASKRWGEGTPVVAGAWDKTIQVRETCATLSLGHRNHYLTVPSGKPSFTELALTEQ